MHLLTYHGHFQDPSNSPFCVKAMCLLQMSGLDWRPKFTSDPRKAPYSKLPVLIDGTTTVADSTEIANYLQKKANIDFNAGLSANEKAQSHAIVRMIEEHLYFALVHERWANDDNWSHIRTAYFEDIPRFIRPVITNGIRKTALNALKGQGLGRLIYPILKDRIKSDLNAIQVTLAEKPFLFGNQPTLADASAGPFLAALAVTPVATPITQMVSNTKILMAYVDRVRHEIYPKL